MIQQQQCCLRASSGARRLSRHFMPPRPPVQERVFRRPIKKPHACIRARAPLPPARWPQGAPPAARRMHGVELSARLWAWISPCQCQAARHQACLCRRRRALFASAAAPGTALGRACDLAQRAGGGTLHQLPSGGKFQVGVCLVSGQHVTRGIKHNGAGDTCVQRQRGA